MSLKIKIVSGVVAAILVAAAVTGIAYLSTQFESKGVEPGLYVGGERVDDPGVMMKVGEYEVGFDEYRYFYMMNKSFIEQSYGENIWDSDYDGAMTLELRKATEESIVSLYSWLKIAEEEGITLTDEEKQEVLDTMAEQKEQLGEEGFAQNLEDMYLTSEEMYVDMTEKQKLLQKTQETLNEEMTSEVEENLDDYLLTAKHILISFDDPTGEAQSQASAEEELLDAVGDAAAASESAAQGSEENVQQADEPDVSVGSETAAEGDAASSEATALSEEEAEALAKQRADELVAMLEEAQANGADLQTVFDELMWAYGQDPGVETYPNGYTFGEGEMVTEFYEGAMALEPGAFSAPIRTDYGYHIIMRMPLDTESLEDVDTSVQNIVSSKMTALLTETQESLPVEYGAYYEEVTPQGMY